MANQLPDDFNKEVQKLLNQAYEQGLKDGIFGERDRLAEWLESFDIDINSKDSYYVNMILGYLKGDRSDY